MADKICEIYKYCLDMVKRGKKNIVNFAIIESFL